MFGPITNLYNRRMKSLRGEMPDYYSYSLPQTIRHKIIGRILDANFMKGRDLLLHEGEYDELDEYAVVLEREFGKSISSKISNQDKIVDFLFTCTNEDFLSALELLCTVKVQNIYQFDRHAQPLKTKLLNLIDSVNKIFRLEKIGYEIIPVSLDDLPFIVVPFNSQYLYLDTIKRPMSLLYDEDFKGPLNEFETALDKYRKEDYDGAIVEACNSYESALKTILQLKKIPFDEKKDKIPNLVDKFISANLTDTTMKTIFDSFWPVLKNGPNNIRNLAGIAHGQGIDVKKAQREYADFVLRTVGTYIVFLIERYRESK